MTFWDHLEELRIRIIYCIVFFTGLFLIFWLFRDQLLSFCLTPVIDDLKKYNGEVILLKITDHFFIHLKVVLVFSFVGSFPVLYYHIWKFIKPALIPEETRLYRFFFIVSFLLFLAGVFLSVTTFVPLFYSFLIKYSQGTQEISSYFVPKLALSLSDHISITQKIVLITGLVFQIPLAILLALKLKLLSRDVLLKFRKHVLVLCFIMAAILTPPDPLSMILLAIPMVLLFEAGLLLDHVLSVRASK